MSSTILVVEDEPAIAELIAVNLSFAGHKVLRAADADQAKTLITAELPDLVLLDWMLPGKTGIQFAHELRGHERTRHVPVIMLTARAQTEDRIQGLQAGADDYLAKPFSPKELLLRVQAILKRLDSPSATTDLVHGPFRFDKNAVKCYIDNEPAELTSTEFKLLLFLCERPGRPQDRNDLLRTIWGYSDAAHSRTLDTHMKRLRQKLGPHGSWIETIRGVGYQVANSQE